VIWICNFADLKVAASKLSIVVAAVVATVVIVVEIPAAVPTL
jgi:hypothetical protein